MNGIDFLIDTNISIYVLEGHPVVNGIMQCAVAVSVITEMELLGKVGLLAQEKAEIRSLLEDCEILAFTDTIKTTTIALKQQYALKLPDAIIAATAKRYGFPLVTADKDFKKLDGYIDVILLDF